MGVKKNSKKKFFAFEHFLTFVLIFSYCEVDFKLKKIIFGFAVFLNPLGTPPTKFEKFNLFRKKKFLLVKLAYIYSTKNPQKNLEKVPTIKSYSDSKLSQFDFLTPRGDEKKIFYAEKTSFSSFSAHNLPIRQKK